MIGQTISKYRVVEKLGFGGPGEVYLAEDIELGRKVVLKFLAEAVGSDAETLARFRRDAQAVAALHHPNIVTVYKVGEHAGRPFVAKEYVEGRTLADMIANESIAPDAAAGIVTQICEGLSAAHQSGLFHRDIRPDNILIGHGGRARIADFGLSPGVEGDSRSDVQSVGALLREMDSEDHFEAIISRALSEDPDDRYPTVEALATDLQAMQSPQSGQAPSKARRAILPFAIAAVLALVVTLLLVWKPFEQREIGGGLRERHVIAVLPFENLGEAGDEYFADGVTDEITSRLTRMQGLAVISRTSARIYKNTQKSIREIGDELNADYVIEGTIRWDKSRGKGRVRITPQLIRVSDDTHVWGDTYEREITEIFDVQADIATQIAKALDVTLLEGERRAVTAEPTENIDAYEAYLRGMKQLDAPDFSRESFELGVEMFERAVTLDPKFALAYAKLSTMHARMVHYGFDRSQRRLDLAKTAVDQAFLLQPDLAEAYLSLGYYYYWGMRDYRRALASLDAARERAPNSSEIRQATAYVKRRQGDLETCAELLERDLALSPLDAGAAIALGETYSGLRRYPAAERSLQRGISLAPDNVYPYTELALVYLRWRGDTAAAREILKRAPTVSSTEFFRVGFFVELFDRDYAAALSRLDACPERALEAAAFFLPISLLKGITFRMMRDPAAAKSAFEASRVVLEEKLARDSEDYRVHSALGIAYAGLGRAEDAIRHGKLAVDLYPLSRDALAAPALIIDLALIYAMVGDHESAVRQLEYVLSIPSIISVPWLAKDPRWDPLRQHPQFVALLDKYQIGAEH